jgi:hypothetical protein
MLHQGTYWSGRWRTAHPNGNRCLNTSIYGYNIRFYVPSIRLTSIHLFLVAGVKVVVVVFVVVAPRIPQILVLHQLRDGL